MITVGNADIVMVPWSLMALVCRSGQRQSQKECAWWQNWGRMKDRSPNPQTIAAADAFDTAVDNAVVHLTLRLSACSRWDLPGHKQEQQNEAQRIPGPI